MGEKSTTKPLAVIPPILLAVLAILFSLAWLVPNHTRPWLAFYSDAIVASVLLLIAGWVFIRSPGRFELVGIGFFFVLLATVPGLQFAVGLIHSSGTAWINSLYLVGFSLAIFLGWHWEKSTPGQCLDFLFLAICCAAVVSVGIQLMQWLQLTSGNFWVLHSGRSRFFANMAQPNQLASLLLLGVLGVTWGYARKAVGGALALVFIAYLLLGVALTESRTAWLNIAGILVALFLFWRKGRPKYLAWVLVGFGVYFAALNFSLPAINNLLFGEATVRRALGDPIRLAFWKSLVVTLMESPWFGYGWGQTTAAVFAATNFPDTGAMTKHSHNLLLDLFLYNGLLLGGLVVAVVAATAWRLAGCLKREHFIIPAIAVGVLLVHAMLELPLHYAYFLLPFGMMIGVLSRSEACSGEVRYSCPKSIAIGFVMVVAASLWITIADCLEAERTYYNVYFGKKGKAVPPEMQPELRVLTQWRDRLVLANTIPGAGLTPERERWMNGVVIATPESFLIFQLAQSLALNGEAAKAKAWLEKMCKMAPDSVTQDLTDQWDSAAEGNERYRLVDWQRCPPKKVVIRDDTLPME